MSHRVALAAAETRPSVTTYKYAKAEIDLLSGTFTLHFVKVDSAGVIAGASSVEGTLNGTDLTVVIQKLSDQAQVEGKIPAGTFGQD